MSYAYLYEKTKGGRKFVCSTFQNSHELVTIYHDSTGIFHQFFAPGMVEYDPVPADIESELPSCNFVRSENEVGHVVHSVWRPGLCLDIPEALSISDDEKHRAKKDLKILIEKLHEVLLYVEPDATGFKSYGHKIRELLILACTEVENSWVYYMRLAGNTSSRLTTKDYVKLCNKLKLHEFKIVFNSHPLTIEFIPFAGWSNGNPTGSLDWYNAYNKTKHDKGNHFSEATLGRCLNAVVSNIVMFCVRYSPYELIEGKDICSNLVNEYFDIELVNPAIESFYVPLLQSARMATGAFSGPLGSGFEEKWQVDPFVL